MPNGLEVWEGTGKEPDNAIMAWLRVKCSMHRAFLRCLLGVHLGTLRQHGATGGRGRALIALGLSDKGVPQGLESAGGDRGRSPRKTGVPGKG